MFTKTEKGYLVLTLAFLAAGSGIKAYRHAAVKLGPFQDTHQDTRRTNLHDIRDARVIPQSGEVAGDASVPEASAAGPDTSGESSPTLAAGPVSPGGGVFQIDGTRIDGPQIDSPHIDSPHIDSPKGRDTVNDSSTLTSTPIKSDAAPDRGPAGAFGKTPGIAPTRAPKPTSKAAFTAKVDLNRAEASELTRVPGIGAKTARAIVDYRRVHGPYRDFRDLLRIKGIGEKKLEKLMPNLIL